MLLDTVCRLAKALALDAVLELDKSDGFYEARVSALSDAGLEVCGIGSTRAESLRLLGWAIHNELRDRGLPSDWAMTNEVAA